MYRSSIKTRRVGETREEKGWLGGDTPSWLLTVEKKSGSKYCVAVPLLRETKLKLKLKLKTNGS
jgi:hypothetical protein